MKTRDEMAYEFMLALATNIPPDYLKWADSDPEDLEPIGEAITLMAYQLTRSYLDTLESL
jgi:hypothetical protein